MSLLIEGLTNYRAEVATLPTAVYVWMWFMRTVLIAGGLIFIGTRAGRVVFPVMVVNILGLWYGKGLWPDLSLGLLGTGLHIILWVPMAIYLIAYVRAQQDDASYNGPHNGQDNAAATPYHRLSYGWAWLCLIVIGISLLFDVREIATLAAVA